MYFIQGADQKEYGPITADQLRQWIGENRLNRSSLARSDADPTWKPLSEFPEFAEAFGTVTAGTTAFAAPYAGVTPVGPVPGAAEAAVKPPAIALLVTGILGILVSVWGVVAGILGVGKNQPTPPMPPEMERFMKAAMDFSEKFGVVTSVLSLVMAAVTVFAAVRMMQLRSITLVYIGTILAMVQVMNCCCCLGIPFGIWALVVLNKSEVRAAFR